LDKEYKRREIRLRRITMNKSLFCLLIILGIMVLFGSDSLLRAQPPDITVNLSFDKKYYKYGEPIGVTVEVKNETGRDVYISKGFGEKEYYLQMRVIDPAGRLVLPKLDLPHDEFPDAPPLPFCVKNDGGFTRVAPYEILRAGSPPIISQTSDIRNYYPLKFPGTYSFEVQLSAMTWNPVAGDPCIGDINNYESLGVFKSKTKYIGTQGSTKVSIHPDEWSIGWKNEQFYPEPVLFAIIIPEEGKTVDDYNMDYIQLNNVKATNVVIDGPYPYNKYFLVAFFEGMDAINTLGNVVVGSKYRVVISGTMKDGGYFGGEQKIKIIE
jgi:hypothetical protein